MRRRWFVYIVRLGEFDGNQVDYYNAFAFSRKQDAVEHIKRRRLRDPYRYQYAEIERMQMDTYKGSL